MLEQNLLILTSPPASGKTFWISKFKDSIGDKSVLVISPLRALRDECKGKWGDTIEVMTPEEWPGKKVSTDIVIFDEFHLFFYWGDTFRPLMWEVFYEISGMSELIVLMTATMGNFMQTEMKHFATQFDSITWMDCGNQVLKYRPQKYLKAPSKQWMRDIIFSHSKNSSVKLIFCKYRNEVFQWEQELSAKGFNCVSCVGGESKYMAEKLRVNPTPDFIISTTVLSHGVNLPNIQKIFFTYQIQNIDFWIQMVARGGRRGEKFEVFALERPHDLHWNYLRNLVDVVFFGFIAKLTAFFQSKILLK